MKSPHGKPKAVQVGSTRNKVHSGNERGSDSKKQAEAQVEHLYSVRNEFGARGKKSKSKWRDLEPDFIGRLWVSPDERRFFASPMTLVDQLRSQGVEVVWSTVGATSEPFHISPADEVEKAAAGITAKSELTRFRKRGARASTKSSVSEPVQQYSAGQFGPGLDIDPGSDKCIDTSRLEEYGVRHIEALYRQGGK